MESKYDMRDIPSDLLTSVRWKDGLDDDIVTILEQKGFQTVEDFLDIEIYKFFCVEGIDEDTVADIMRELLNSVFPDASELDYEDEQEFYSYVASIDYDESEAVMQMDVEYFPGIPYNEITVRHLICNPWVSYFSIADSVYSISWCYHSSVEYDETQTFADKDEMEYGGVYENYWDPEWDCLYD